MVNTKRSLILFAKKSGYEAAKWDLTVSNHGQREKTEKLTVNDDNDLVLQTVEFPQGTKSLTYEAKGTGAALVQISYQYNIVEKDPKPSFKVETIIKPESPPSKLELTVCVEYVEEGKAKASNMAILEVSLPSGYTADEESFKDIQDIERVRVCTKEIHLIKTLSLIALYTNSSWRPKTMTLSWLSTLRVCPRVKRSVYPSRHSKPMRLPTRSPPQLYSTITTIPTRRPPTIIKSNQSSATSVKEMIVQPNVKSHHLLNRSK